MEINVIHTDANMFDDLVEHNALTIEGLNLSSIEDFVNWIEEYTPLKRKDVYVTKGALANHEWHLTGCNAYSDNLNIVSVKLNDMEDFNKIVLPRFNIGARWMGDIYDNNVRRQVA